jgi:predicted kinase
MKKLIIMKGLPGSGKSTYAKQLVKENPNTYKRINRDELRMMFDDGYTSKGNEKFIRQVRDMLIIKALEEGKHVIIDDTNLSETNITRISQLVHQHNITHNDDVMVEIKEMTTTLQECIERDSLREKKVGEKVIREMHRQFYSHEEDRYISQELTLPKAIVCDLDGTLTLLNGRNPFDASTCDNDLPNKPVVNVIKMYQSQGYKIIFCTGREDKFRTPTETWLRNYDVKYDLLLMRKTKDLRKDSIIKKEIYESHIVGKYFVEFVLDDRNQVVNMWRDELRLPCFQVYYGDF